VYVEIDSPLPFTHQFDIESPLPLRFWVLGFGFGVLGFGV
jgi:hypothetical protein